MFGLIVDMLCYYEWVGVILLVYCNESGYWDYKMSDLNWVYFVKNLWNVGLLVELLIEFVIFV